MCDGVLDRQSRVMSIFLYKLARFAFRRRLAMVGFWLVTLVLGGIGAATLSGPTVDAFSIPGTESQAAQDLLAERFPEAAAGGAGARVVFESPSGTTLTDPGVQQSVKTLVSTLGQDPEVAEVSDPYTGGGVSPDGTIGYLQVSYTQNPIDLPDSSREMVKNAVAEASKSGLAVDVSGSVLVETGAESLGEIIGVAIAAVVLTVTFGSLVAAGLPLISALVGIGIAVSTITIATGFIELGSSTTILALMLGLAVAIDYSLFIVSRYRAELRDGHEPEIAAGRAGGTAGSAVVFAGLTVVIALAGLFVVNIPFLTTMGLAAAFAVAVAVVISLTLLPATLGFAGSRVLTRSDRRLLASGMALTEQKPTVRGGTRWARWVIAHRIPVLVAAVLGLGLLAIPAVGIKLSLASPPAPDTTVARATDRLTEGFGAGFNGPLMVVVDVALAPDPASALAATQETVSGLAGVVAASPPVPNAAGDTAIMTVIPAGGPESEATQTLVADLRDSANALKERTGAAMSVTGQTAITIDVSKRLSDALVPYLALVVGLAFVLLMLVLPVDPGTAQGDPRVPALDRGHVRGTRCHLPVGLVRRVARHRRSDRCDRGHAADIHGRHRIRPRHGLSGIPGDPHARVLRPRRGTRRVRGHGLRSRRARGDCGGADHDCGVRGFHLRRRGLHHADRPRTCGRRPVRRLRDSNDGRPGGDVVAR
ncbi:RND superfamily putative drug exporter [Rhodococcus sp. 27YEA15]